MIQKQWHCDEDEYHSFFSSWSLGGAGAGAGGAAVAAAAASSFLGSFLVGSLGFGWPGLGFMKQKQEQHGHWNKNFIADLSQFYFKPFSLLSFYLLGRATGEY